ncbi:MAG: hypothetical protein CFE37_02465 [Alphaproteobacteria bacterium PA4]|nr:MAG: hypothetical protein CFE37_02465 [Alphaproteobacteria bacterium PA4]
MTLPPARLHIALVHNHQPDRNAYLLPRLEALSTAFAAALTLVAWQPPLVPHKLMMRVYRDWRQYRLQLAWSRYRGFGVRAALGIHRGFAGQLAALARDPARRQRLCRISTVETFVTAKHIVAWQAFLDGDASHLLVCEDDLIFHPDSADRLRAALTDAAATPGLRHVDLAGGLAPDRLGIDRLVTARDDGRIHYARAVTNTACGYLLSRELAGHFLAILLRRPDLRLLGIDWMLNAMLMQLRRDGIAVTGLHHDPPIFGHGTFSGAYTSWMQVALAGD